MPASATARSILFRYRATVSRQQGIGHARTVKADPEVQAFIRNANRNLGVIGYTEHGFRHVGLVANIARNI